MEGIWGIVVIGGPVLLALVIAFAIIRNRQQSTPASEAHTERATKKLYDELGREDQRSGGS